MKIAYPDVKLIGGENDLHVLSFENGALTWHALAISEHL
jgi:hypothetical protein